MTPMTFKDYQIKITPVVEPLSPHDKLYALIEDQIRHQDPALTFKAWWLLLNMIVQIILYVFAYFKQFCFDQNAQFQPFWFFLPLIGLLVQSGLYIISNWYGWKLPTLFQQRMYVIWLNYTLILMLNIFSLWAAFIGSKDLVGGFLTGEAKENWQTTWKTLPDRYVNNFPHIMVYLGANNTLPSGTYMDELLKERCRNTQLYNGMGVGISFWALQALATILILGYEESPSWSLEQRTSKACLTLDTRNAESYLAIEKVIKKIKETSESSYNRVIMAVTTLFMSMIFAIMIGKIQTSTGGIALTRRFLIEYQYPIWGLLALPASSTYTFQHHFVVSILNFVLPAIAWFGLWVGVFTPSLLFQERNCSRVHLIGSIIDPTLKFGRDEASFKNVRLRNVIEDGQVDDWLALREYMKISGIELDHNKSEWGILALLIIDLGLGTYITISYLVNRNFGAGMWGPWAIVACPVLTVGLFILLAKAVEMSVGQADHIRLLRISKENYQTHHIETTDLKIDEVFVFRYEKSLELIDTVCQRLADYDKPVKVLNIDITPTFFNLFIGYIVSAGGAIVISYMSSV